DQHADPEHRLKRADPERHDGQRAVRRPGHAAMRHAATRHAATRHAPMRRALTSRAPAHASRIGFALALALWAMPALAGSETDIRVPSGGAYGGRVTSLKAARYRTTVPQKFDFSCGSAATATLLTYQYGRPVGEAEVFERMYALGDQARIRTLGFSMLDMRRF